MTIGRDALDYNLKWRIRTPADSGGLIPSLVTEAQLVGYDGTTTKLVRVDTDGHTQVDVLSAVALPAGTNLLGKVGIDQVTANANEVVLKAGTALAGKVGIDQTTPGTTNKVDLGSSPAAMTLATGEVLGNVAATVFPTLACKLVNIKACPDNVGKVYIGVSGVTKADGTSDTTTGWVLSAGEETGFLPLANMSSLFRICDNAGDDVVYMALS